MRDVLNRIAAWWWEWWRFLVVQRVGYRRELAITEADLERVAAVERELNRLEVTLLYLKVRFDLHTHVESRHRP